MRREQVFWGWGEPGAGPSVSAHAIAFLRDELGVSGEVVSSPVALDDVRLRDPSLDVAGLRAIVGEEAVRQDRAARVLRCRGKSYLDLLAQRAGDCEDAPDAVVAPAGHDQVLAVLQWCAERGVAVVPFGGGTSVVGGLEPLRGRFEHVISLDLARMDGVVGVDRESLTAVLEPGLRLPEADRALGAHGLTLGHVPQSYEWASVGGCVATRSAGQASTGRGRIDANVVGVRCATPLGELATLAAPASAAGPALRQLVAGSEGVLGVITRVALRVHPLPAARRFEGWLAPDFAAGCAAFRQLAQAGAAPDVARLSDEEETRFSLAFAGLPPLARRGLGRRCLVICGWEGSEATIKHRRRAAARALRAAGAWPATQRAGREWVHSRFAGPYLRDGLMDRGVMVETLETATSWSNLGRLHAAVRRALGDVLAGCHVSHLYPTGASLYFTVFGRRDGADPAGQWRSLKRAATGAIVEAGGTITHHHAIGRDHAPWLPDEDGRLGVEVLRAVKERCDPAGIMNPGKLLPA
ncbi:MAG TPA: FAD-binding oxidoreductase [Solirubrobacteraceae bacterium]|nr:FAD-binding oxidoreductase [Solirubrobacteraceae bacterium]